MALIVAVHGVAHDTDGPESMHARILPGLNDGLRYTGHRLEPDDLAIAFYGDLFRPDLSQVDRPRPWGYSVEFLAHNLSTGLRLAWSDRDPMQVPLALARSAVDVAWREVGRYLDEADMRAAVQERVAAAVTDDTRVVVAHSLGTVVAYEALCANPDWPMTTLVTAGSPLGIRGLVFDRLRPGPEGGRGVWPGSIEHWTNVADDHDRVALEPRLANRFGDRVVDRFVYNRDRPHDPHPYFTSREAGAGIALGMASP